MRREDFVTRPFSAGSKRGARLAAALALACLPLACPLGAQAAASIPIAVAPLGFKLDAATDYGALQVSNRGQEPTGVEIEIRQVRWVDGVEQYGPTEEFVVSPPAFRLQPNKDRTVRFRYGGTRGDAEGFYRLFVRQLPSTTEGKQVNMVFNIGVPIFVAPLTAQPALAITPAGVRNTGNITLTLSGLQGAACAPAPPALQARLAPQQSLRLEGDFSRCATLAQTDRGLIPLAAP